MPTYDDYDDYDDYADYEQPDLMTFKDRDGKWGRTWCGTLYDLTDPEDLAEWRELERLYGYSD